MQDEMNRKSQDSLKKTVTLVFRGGKLTGEVMLKLMKKFIDDYKKKHHHKISLNKLLAKGEGASSIELGTEGNLTTFKKIARKYNIDYAIKVDKTTNPPTHLAFFKAKETDVIAQAFKEYVAKNQKKQNKTSFAEKLKKMKDIIAKQPKKKEVSRKQERSRGKER